MWLMRGGRGQWFETDFYTAQPFDEGRLLKIGLLTRNQNAWCSSRLREAFLKSRVEPVCFSFSDLTAQVGMPPNMLALGNINLVEELGAVLIRPIGRGSLDEVIFQMDALHKLSRDGLPVINHPAAIEKSVDKYYTLALLNEAGLPVPRTVVTGNVAEAVKAFEKFGGDAVVKPVFGSRGIGTARISNADVAERVFRTLRFHRHVIYVQEFVPHGTKDHRVFIVGGRVVASMLRVSNSWKTNVSRGATPIPSKASGVVEDLAVSAAETIGCDIAGIDVLEGREGPLINELNSQPGWRGLQSTTKIDIAAEIVKHVLKRAKG